MAVLIQELKKLINFRMLWVFFAFCLLFNISLIITDHYPGKYANYVGNIANKTGYILGDTFQKKLEIADIHDTEYYKQLVNETNNIVDVFDNYNVLEVGETYVDNLELKGSIAEKMKNKYVLLQRSVDKKEQNNESLTLYLASSTYNIHSFLFTNLLSKILLEGALIGVLAVLFSLDYEQIYKTEDVVYATREGRNLISKKLYSGIIIGTFFYIIIAIISLILFLTLNKFGSILGSSISSSFNFIKDTIIGIRPFTTWNSFSILSYIIAFLILSIGLIICFMLIAFCLGVLVRNIYIGFAIFVISNALFLLLPSYISTSNILFYTFVLSPVNLWMKQGLWFTDGGIEVLWPNFEIRGVMISFILLSVSSIIFKTQFGKRDLI